MAEVVAVIASTHHPFYLRASTATGEARPPFADEWVAKVETFRATLTRVNPDLLVMVGSDHFHQLWLDNMPQFLIGKAPFYDANWYNEEREFGLPRMRLAGNVDLSSHLLRQGLDAGFDLAFSNELRIDHSITCPIITLRPQADLPIVPIYTNIFAPPLPQPARFVESWPSHLRVAIIGTGHLSLELGGPRQFGPHGPDPEFDRKAVDWIAKGDIEGCLAEVTLDSLHTPGNATHGFMDFMLMMGVAGDHVAADGRPRGCRPRRHALRHGRLRDQGDAARAVSSRLLARRDDVAVGDVRARESRGCGGTEEQLRHHPFRRQSVGARV